MDGVCGCRIMAWIKEKWEELVRREMGFVSSRIGQRWDLQVRIG